ncbi:sugar phosphate isomerase/epimerase family protein [Streptomyces sp. NPDC007088]|uniref:sugar phosphate isomerase/epimerase family protein n=1 Tax=Streptomyces sp. NPDC007088 TaxID=3364773 RepID=UPI0036851E32
MNANETNDAGGRPVTLTTVQWTDVPLPDLCRDAASWGYDGLALACHPRHFDAVRAAADPSYADEVRALLDAHGLRVHALAAHMIGQALCDPVDHRHRRLLPPEIWGDGDPEGVRKRAARVMTALPAAAARLGADTVVGFTGSPVWHMFMLFPPVEQDDIDAGYREFASRLHPVLDAFDAAGVRFALEVHPTEVAYDYWTTARTLDVLGHRPAFGLNLDPSHFLWQGLDPAVFAVDYRERIYHVDLKDAVRREDGRAGVLGSHLPWGNPRRGWDFVTPGHGQVDFESLLRALNYIGYAGPLSVEWEDAGMDRGVAAPDALRYVRALTRVRPSAAAFDSAFDASGKADEDGA